MPKEIHIAIASGGTGGHLYPTIAVADEIKRLEPSAKILFIGTADRIESREVPRAGYPFEAIKIAAPKKNIRSLFSFPIRFLGAVMHSRKLLKAFAPSSVLCGGAYLSVPVGVAARMLGIPVVLLEINSVAGKANKLLSRWAKKIYLAYPESASQFVGVDVSGIATSGTPVRTGFGSHHVDQRAARLAYGFDPDRKTILIFGGSLGARAINRAVASNAAALLEQGYSILWQIGKGNDAKKFQEDFANERNIRVEEYIYEMEQAYAAADLVVCRAGASSLAELAALGKPAILVPFPDAAENHQEANARAFEAVGAALVLRDSELSERIAETITSLSESALEAMSIAMKHRENKEAAKIVAQWLIASDNERALKH